MARIKKIVLGLHYIFFLDNPFFLYADCSLQTKEKNKFLVSSFHL